MNNEWITGLTSLTLVLLGPLQQCLSFLLLLILPVQTTHLPSFKTLPESPAFPAGLFQPTEPTLSSPALEYSIPGGARAQGTFSAVAQCAPHTCPGQTVWVTPQTLHAPVERRSVGPPSRMQQRWVWAAV